MKEQTVLNPMLNLLVSIIVLYNQFYHSFSFSASSMVKAPNFCSGIGTSSDSLV